jgi:hypothetical protein
VPPCFALRLPSDRSRRGDGLPERARKMPRDEEALGYGQYDGNPAIYSGRRYAPSVARPAGIARDRLVGPGRSVKPYHFASGRNADRLWRFLFPQNPSARIGVYVRIIIYTQACASANGIGQFFACSAATAASREPTLAESRRLEPARKPWILSNATGWGIHPPNTRAAGGGT